MPRPRKAKTLPSYHYMTLGDWGEASDNHACHLIYGDRIGATVLEPSRRNTATWDDEDERGFRSEIRSIVDDWSDDPDAVMLPDTLVFDPGRDSESTEVLRP